MAEVRDPTEWQSARPMSGKGRAGRNSSGKVPTVAATPGPYFCLYE
jgi:hypothetical protein